MIQPGLVSITFRKLTPAAIIQIAAESGLSAIEWGADIHVPAGDGALAKQVGRQTRDSGLKVAAYGSYYHIGFEPPGLFEYLLATAVSLGAPIIRVWAGAKQPSETVTDGGYARVAADGRRIAELAAAANVRVACEWHGYSLTDCAKSATRLFSEVDHPNFWAYWQPHSHMPVEGCLADLEVALPHLVGLHVYHRDLETSARRPLAGGEALWRATFQRAAAMGDMYAHLEFVVNDDVDQLREDAAALKRWLAETQF